MDGDYAAERTESMISTPGHLCYIGQRHGVTVVANTGGYLQNYERWKSVCPQLTLQVDPGNLHRLERCFFWTQPVFVAPRH